MWQFNFLDWLRTQCTISGYHWVMTKSGQRMVGSKKWQLFVSVLSSCFEKFVQCRVALENSRVAASIVSWTTTSVTIGWRIIGLRHSILIEKVKVSSKKNQSGKSSKHEQTFEGKNATCTIDGYVCSVSEKPFFFTVQTDSKHRIWFWSCLVSHGREI